MLIPRQPPRGQPRVENKMAPSFRRKMEEQQDHCFSVTLPTSVSHVLTLSSLCVTQTLSNSLPVNLHCLIWTKKTQLSHSTTRFQESSQKCHTLWLLRAYSPLCSAVRYRQSADCTTSGHHLWTKLPSTSLSRGKSVDTNVARLLDNKTEKDEVSKKMKPMCLPKV